jgi:hypothetical protein
MQRLTDEGMVKARQFTELRTKIATASLLEMDITSTVQPSRSLGVLTASNMANPPYWSKQTMAFHCAKAEHLEGHVLA